MFTIDDIDFCDLEAFTSWEVAWAVEVWVLSMFEPMSSTRKSIGEI